MPWSLHSQRAGGPSIFQTHDAHLPSFFFLTNLNPTNTLPENTAHPRTPCWPAAPPCWPAVPAGWAGLREDQGAVCARCQRCLGAIVILFSLISSCAAALPRAWALSISRTWLPIRWRIRLCLTTLTPIPASARRACLLRRCWTRVREGREGWKEGW